jgi:hypothetical protein
MNLWVRNYFISDLPMGKSMDEWIRLWWEWCYSDTIEASPVADLSGELCNKRQSHPGVWFLAGTFGGYAERKCFIPVGKSIFFPVLNDIISFATDPQLKNEEELSSYAKADLDETRALCVSVDGNELHDIEQFRIRTSPFELRLPKSKFVGSYETTRCVSDGYWIFLKPLDRGQHTIYFMGEKLEFDKIVHNNYERLQAPTFRVEVNYNLTIY